MAKDILDAVRLAEEESKNRENDAKKAAQKKLESAKKDAQALIKNADAEFSQENEKLFSEARSEGERIRQKAEQAAADKCSDIHKVAQRNRENVIGNAINAILN